MSCGTYTDLWIAPKDFNRPVAKRIFEASWQFGDDMEVATDEKEDVVILAEHDQGLIHLVASEHASYDEMCQLTSAGVPFFAHEDSRLDAEGGQMVFVSWRKKSVYLQENGNGQPVVPVYENGKTEPRDMKAARQYYRLHRKVCERAKKLSAPEVANEEEAVAK